MSDQMAKHVVKTLVSNFGRNFPQEGMKKIWPELVSLPAKAISAAGDYIVLNNTFLPSPAQLLDRAKNEAKKVAAEDSKQREADWHKQKGGSTPEEIRRAGSIFSQKQRDEIAKRSIEGIMVMLSPDISRKNKLELFKVMDDLYPGIGYANEGARLKREWERDGLI